MSNRLEIKRQNAEGADTSILSILEGKRSEGGGGYRGNKSPYCGRNSRFMIDHSYR